MPVRMMLLQAEFAKPFHHSDPEVDLRKISGIAKPPVSRPLKGYMVPKVARRAITDAAERYGVLTSAVTSHNATGPAIEAKTTAIRTLRDNGWTLTQIGRVFGLHHTTVMYHLTRHLSEAFDAAGKVGDKR